MTCFPLDLNLAHRVFVSSLDAFQQQQSDVAILSEVYQEKVDRLEQGMCLLNELAAAGMEEQLTPLLSTLLQEWAMKEAAEMLLRYPHRTCNPTHPDLQQFFWEKLIRQQQVLSSEVFLQLQKGKEQRVYAQEEREQSWQRVAITSFERQQELSQQWFEHQLSMFNTLQQENRAWANVAMTSTQQAQIGLKQWYGSAASTQPQELPMPGRAEQRQAPGVQDTVRKGNRKRWLPWLISGGLVIGVLMMLYGGAFFALMHLY